MKIVLTSAAALVALGISTAPALAQGQQQQQQYQQRDMQQGAPNFEREELQAYASAALEVRSINEEFTKKLQSAESQADQKAVREEATQEMVEAIKGEGLSVARYNEIYQAANANPEIAEEVNKYVKEAQ